MTTFYKRMTLNKLGCAVLLTCAGGATNAMAVDFVATDTATLQANATFSGGNLVALTGPATMAPGAYTVTVPLDAAGNPVSLNVAGGPAGSVVPTATSGPLIQQLPQLGAPTAYKGLTATGLAVKLKARGNLVAPTVASPTSGLTYSNFGRWQIGARGLVTTGPLVVQMFAGGTAPTLAAQMPITGSASYSGKVAIAGTDAAGQLYEGSSQIRLAANFGANGITGTVAATPVTNSITQSPAGSFNSLSMSGTFVGNAFTGTVTTLAGPVVDAANPLAVQAGVIGTTSGQFYGPSANEVTGTLSLSAGTTNVIGSFGAKR